MEVAQLSFGADIFGRTSTGGIYAKLRLDIGQLSFPDPDWTDFPVIVLGWWCRAMFSLLSKKVADVAVRFMEGPYLVILKVVERDTWDISLIECGLNERVQHSAQIRPGPLIQSILTSAEQAMLLCEREGWFSKDYDELESSLLALRGISADLQRNQ